MENINIELALLTCHYDNWESEEREIGGYSSPCTLDDLKKYAREVCETEHMDNDYFSSMTMASEPQIAFDIDDSGDGYIDISFDFTDENFTTDMQVSFTVKGNR